MERGRDGESERPWTLGGVYVTDGGDGSEEGETPGRRTEGQVLLRDTGPNAANAATMAHADRTEPEREGCGCGRKCGPELGDVGAGAEGPVSELAGT